MDYGKVSSVRKNPFNGRPEILFESPVNDAGIRLGGISKFFLARGDPALGGISSRFEKMPPRRSECPHSFSPKVVPHSFKCGFLGLYEKVRSILSGNLTAVIFPDLGALVRG